MSFSQHLWSLEREHCRADRASFVPREMGRSWAAAGLSPFFRPFHKRHFLLLLLLVLCFYSGNSSQKLFFSWVNCVHICFLKTGLEALLATRRSLSSEILSLSRRKENPLKFYVWDLVNISAVV